MPSTADATIVDQMSNLLAAVRAARALVRGPTWNAGYIPVGPLGWERLQAALELIDNTRRNAGSNLNGS